MRDKQAQYNRIMSEALAAQVQAQKEEEDKKIAEAKTEKPQEWRKGREEIWGLHTYQEKQSILLKKDEQNYKWHG